MLTRSQFLVSLIAVPFACRYLERLWGLKELLIFTTVVIVGSNVIAFGFAWLASTLVGLEIAMYVVITGPDSRPISSPIQIRHTVSWTFGTPIRSTRRFHADHS